jgi:uncharacterized Ntn-hydrolase superfamily protein
MTWSIVARDPESGAFGVAVTTKFFAVGALCPYAMTGVGAVATQALVNPMLGPKVLRLLSDGMSAKQALERAIAADEGREARQLHVVDRNGETAQHTGPTCVDWCGHRPGVNYSVAGNMLAGQQVIDRTAEAFEASIGKPLAERFLIALDAGQAAGGDKRGKQSAALRIHSTEEYPDLDLRVDDHAEPLAELRRLYDVSQSYFVHFRGFLPSRAKPAGVYDRAVINAELARLQIPRP